MNAGQLAVCIDCNLFVHGGLYVARLHLCVFVCFVPIEASCFAISRDAVIFHNMSRMYNADGISLIDFYPVGTASCRDVTLGPSPDHLLQWLTGLSVAAAQYGTL
jgi:hypothetical protein